MASRSDDAGDRRREQPRRDRVLCRARRSLPAALVYAYRRGRPVRPRDARFGLCSDPYSHARAALGDFRHAKGRPARINPRRRVAGHGFPVLAAGGEVSRSAILAALGAWPAESFVARGRTLAVYDRAEEVAALRPDFAAMRRVEGADAIATAPGRDGVDFVSRYFAPNYGVDEDPVTGSAHCVLTPYWAARLGKERMTARQISARGGELTCTLRGDRVTIGGHAVLYLEGAITV